MLADTLAHPEDLLEPSLDKAVNPIATRRLEHCTIPTRAHILGIADLPAMTYEHHDWLSFVLFRLRVERPDGDVETCVRQHLPPEIRRLSPGSSLRALAHDSDPRIVVMDWKTSGERLGMKLSWPSSADQYAWPDAAEWPAVDAIEVRDTFLRTRRLVERRASWTPATARLAAGEPTGARVDNRAEWKVTLDLGGRRITVKERVPELALAKLMGTRRGASRLGGVVTTVEIVVNEGTPVAVLVSPAGEVAVDWEATLNQPELRETEPA
jgi:hypothetical protein